MTAAMNFLCPAGKRPGCFKAEIFEQIPKRRKRRLTFSQIFKNTLCHGKTVRFCRIRTFGNCYLETLIQDGTDAFQLSKRESGIFTGELEDQFHPE